MKKKEKESLRTLTPEELRRQASETEGKIASLAVAGGMKAVKNTREIRGLRRRLAVIRTLFREKEREI